jgi:hypothetical protein
MESRSIGFGLAGVAGVGALLAALTSNQASRPTIVTQLPAAAPAERGELVAMRVTTGDSVRASYRHGTVLLEDFTRRHVGCTVAQSARCSPAPATVRHALQVVIASIPDPFDSHLDWAYDAYLEAFRRAFASAGYVPDRYWLPGAADSLDIQIDSVRSRVATHDQFPGVLLFRSANADEPKLALLYLVNELPTTGEHKEAFLAAVRERRILLSDSTNFIVSSNVRDTLLVAGPIFSGAAQSLRLSISDALQFVDRDIRGVRIVTGSATSGANEKTLSGYAGNVGLSFQGTLNSDDAMRTVLQTTLTTLGLRNDQVAILSESSTQYGAQDKASPYLTITFPLNIASLRNEVGDATSDPSRGTGIPGLSSSARTRLELRDKSRPRESPAVVSALTVPTLELMLSEIVQTLADHEIRAVVIQATDIRDQLLLAREIRQRNRDAQIITFQSHRLLLRPEYSSQLNGTLVLTSYPLFLENQWWARNSERSAPRELLALSNDAAVGTYNSILTLLSLDRNRIEYDSPLTQGPGPATPPVWLTAIANNAFVPLTVTSPGPQQQTYFGADAGRPRNAFATLSTSSTHNSSAVLGVVLLGALLVACCAFVIGTRRKYAPLRRSPLAQGSDIPYRRIESHSLLIHERIYATLLIVALSGIFLPIAATMLLVRPDILPKLGAWFVGSVAMIAVAVSVWDVLRLLRRSAADGIQYAFHSARWGVGNTLERSPNTGMAQSLIQSGHLAQLRWLGEIVGRTIVTVIGLLHFALTITYVVQLRSLALDDRPRFLLFSYRALQAWSGVSPLLPLTLCGAGFAVWSMWQWRVTNRLYTATTATEEVALAHARSTRGQALTDPLSRATGYIETARGSLFRIHPGPGGFVLTVILMILGGLIAAQYVGTVERLVLDHSRWRTSYDLLFWIGTYSMLVTGCWALYRIANTWGALQSALIAISETPIFNAFSRLPPHVSKLTRLNIFASSENAATLRTISDRWRELRRQLTELRADSDTGPTDTHAAFDTVASDAMLRVFAKQSADGEFSVFDKRVRMRHIRRTACALITAWQSTDTSPATDGPAPHERRPPSPRTAAAMRTAEEFMAIESVRYVESVLHDLRLLASFLLITLLLSVALMSSYPFQPQGVVKLAFIGLLLGTIVVLFLIMTQMSRDDVLSRITRTDPGKVSWDTTLVLNLVLFGVIPLLALVSSEFPTVRSFLFSWAEPLVRSFIKM